MKIKGIIAIVIIGAALVSCTKSPNSTGDLYVPTSADVTATATLADLQQGRTLYINNCGSCHGLYSPDNFTSSQWKSSIMPSMGSKTPMNSTEKSLVTKYVTRGQ
jgi:mono/diheme cytochrome c family protein